MGRLEICCFNVTSAQIAAEAGADRIELCRDRESGGMTPPLEWLTTIRERHRDTPIFMMVRPRGGDFVYSEEEYHEMKESITLLRGHADGFVFGILKPDKTVDITRTTELVRLAEPLPCTFHKAFDETFSKFQAIEDVIATGCSSILTSGGSPLAIQGTGVLRMISEKANGRIEIIAAGGIRFDSIGHINSTTKADWCHSSALNDGNVVPDAAEIKGMLALVNPMGVKAKQMEAEASRVRNLDR